MPSSITGVNTGGDRVMGSSGGNRFDAVFTDKKDNSLLDPQHFLNLMIVQMQNQDFMNPMDDTAYVTQMAQFSNMQQMQKMTEYSETSYAMSLVGKTVTASRIQTNGSLDTTTGVVDKLSLVDGQYVLYIGGKRYDLSQIMSVETAGKAEDGTTKPQVNTSGMEISKGNVTSDTIEIQWPLPTEDETVSKGLKYTIYYSEQGPFESLAEVENGIKYGDTKTNITELKETIKGLSPDTEYYINIVVQDANNQKSVYKTLKVKTLPQQQGA